ncbi:hypothetical protein [Ensifer sp. B1-9]|uniref:hypothetical protein n=1 Tax=Ensifer sp. B1-9 TaxID=3141455 RepID=UPI003D21F9D4
MPLPYALRWRPAKTVRLEQAAGAPPPPNSEALDRSICTLRDLAQRLNKYREVIQSRSQLVQLDIRAPVRKVGEGVELVFDRLRRDTRGEGSDRDDKRPVIDNGDTYGRGQG